MNETHTTEPGRDAGAGGRAEPLVGLEALAKRLPREFRRADVAAALNGDWIEAEREMRRCRKSGVIRQTTRGPTFWEFA
jgi:hypothetical protein